MTAHNSSHSGEFHRSGWFLSALPGALLLLLSMLLTLHPARAQVAQIQTVDSDGFVGRFGSQAIVLGRPAIAYEDLSNNTIKYAINSAADGSGTWTKVAIGNTGFIRNMSLAVVGGKPAIAYYNSGSGDLGLAVSSTADGTGSWTVQTVDSANDVGQYPSLAEVDGKPAIAYHDNSGNNLKYAINSQADGSGTWTIVTVDSDSWVGYYPSLAVVDGKPAISYGAIVAGTLIYAASSTVDGSGTWTLQTVDTVGSGGGITSLAIVDGRPAIAYLDLNNWDLRWAINSQSDGSGTWATQTIDSAGQVGDYASQQVINGKPTISYQDRTNKDLKFAINSAADGSGLWNTLTVDSPGDVGIYSSLVALDNKPAIAYFDGTNWDLKWALVTAAPPTALSLGRNVVLEQQPVGTFVGTFSTTDPNAGNTFTYSLATGTGDTDNASFTIAGPSLRTAAVFDVATKSSYTVRVRSTDSTGLFTEAPFTITVLEASKPTVAISSPTVNQKVSTTGVTGDIISGTAGDNSGVTAVKVRLSRKRGTTNSYWNGADFVATQIYLDATVTTVGGTSVTWTLSGQLPPTNKLDTGEYGVQAYATDAAGNKSAYASSTFTLQGDTLAPTLAIRTPTANQKLLIADFTSSALGGTTGDDTAVTAVKVRLSRKRGTTNYYWNGTDFGTASAYVDATLNGTNWSLGAATPAADNLDSGAYQAEAYAIDAANNKSATAKVAFTLGTDFTAPTVAISTPTASQVIKINEFGAGTIKGSAADNIGVTSVKLKLQRKRGNVFEYWNGNAFTTTSVLFDATFDVGTGTWSYDSAIAATDLDAGGYTIYATAYDAAGNKTTSASRAFSIVGTASATDAASAAVKSAGSS